MGLMRYARGMRRAVLAALVAIILCSPFVRFDHEPANWWAMFAAVLGVPWWLMLWLLRLRRPWSDLVSAFLAPALLMVTLMLFFADINFRPMRLRAETNWAGSQVRLYSNYWGTFTEIRHERPLVPGVRLVRELRSVRRCPEVWIEGTPAGVRLHAGSGCLEVPRSGIELPLKRFVHF